MIKLTDEHQVIHVQVRSRGSWRKNIHGQVIGSYNGVAGILLASGEYIDVPAERLRVLEGGIEG